MYETCHLKIQDLLFVTCTDLQVRPVLKSTLIIPKTHRSDEKSRRSNQMKLIKYVKGWCSWEFHSNWGYTTGNPSDISDIHLFKCHKVPQRLSVLSLFIRFRAWTRFPMNLHFRIFFSARAMADGILEVFCFELLTGGERSPAQWSNVQCVCARAL